MQEIWKDISGYEGMYQVSNIGRVKSLDHYASNGKKNILYKGKTLTQQKHNYLYICLFKDRKNKRFLIHRLVAQTFIENPNKLPQVNHKDGNKFNNNVSNLEFCTARYNLKHALDNNLRKRKIDISEYKTIYKKNINGKSYRQLADEYNVSKTKIFDIIKVVKNEKMES